MRSSRPSRPVISRVSWDLELLKAATCSRNITATCVCACVYVRKRVLVRASVCHAGVPGYAYFIIGRRWYIEKSLCIDVQIRNT